MSDDLKNDVDFEKPVLNNQVRAEDVFGRLNPAHLIGAFYPNVLTVVPDHTKPPTSFFDQIKIYSNGAGTYRLYWWDSNVNLWHYVTAIGDGV